MSTTEHIANSRLSSIRLFSDIVQNEDGTTTFTPNVDSAVSIVRISPLWDKTQLAIYLDEAFKFYIARISDGRVSPREMRDAFRTILTRLSAARDVLLPGVNTDPVARKAAFELQTLWLIERQMNTHAGHLPPHGLLDHTKVIDLAITLSELSAVAAKCENKYEQRVRRGQNANIDRHLLLWRIAQIYNNAFKSAPSASGFDTVVDDVEGGPFPRFLELVFRQARERLLLEYNLPELAAQLDGNSRSAKSR